MRSSRAYNVFLVSEGVIALGLAMVNLATSIYLIQTAQLTPFQLVLLGTALEVGIFFLEVPTGVVADTYSRRLSVILGFGALGLGAFLVGLTTLFVPLLLLQVVKALGYTLLSGAQQAWLSDEIGEVAANRAFLRGAQVSALAGVVGVIGAILIGSAQVALPILVGGGLLMGMAVVLVAVMPEQGFKPKHHEMTNPVASMVSTFREGVQTVRGSRLLFTIIAVGFVFGAFSEGYDRLNEFHWLQNIGIPEGFTPIVWLGGISVLTTPLYLLLTEWARRSVTVADQAAVARTLRGLMAALIVAVAVFALARNAVLALAAYVMIGQLRGVIAPLYTAWVNQNLAPQTRATIISMSAQADALGEMAGGPMVGLLGNLSVRAALIVSAALLSPSLWLFRRALRREALPESQAVVGTEAFEPAD